MALSLVLFALAVANTGFELTLEGQGELATEKEYQFSKGKTDNFGADVTVAQDGKSAKVDMWLSDDGSWFLSVTAGTGKCVLLASGGQTDDTANLQTYSEAGIKCSPRRTTPVAPQSKFVVLVEEDSDFSASCDSKYQGDVCHPCDYNKAAETCTMKATDALIV